MISSDTTLSTSAAPAAHPQRGRRYTIEELRALADRGDPWALCQVDQWELEFGDEYAGALSERCTDPCCDGYGERADVCCDQDGRPLDVDHGGWGHGVSWARAA